MYDRNYSNTHRSNSNSFAAHQVIQYNDLLMEAQRLREDNYAFHIRIQKYQQLQPYIDTLIATNSDLKSSLQSLENQNNYLTKETRNLHIQIKQSEVEREAIVKNSANNLQKATKQLNDRMCEIQRLKNQIQNVYKVLKNSKQENQQQIRVNECANEEIKSLNNQIAKLQTQVSKVHAYNNQISQNYHAKEDILNKTIKQKEKSIQSLQKQLKQQIHRTTAVQQQSQNLHHQIGELNEAKINLQRNHDSLLKDFKIVTLKRAELQQLLNEQKFKCNRREEQLKEVQCWRNQQRDRYRKEISEREKFMDQQISELKDVIQNKKVKNQQLMASQEKIQLLLQQRDQQNAIQKGELQSMRDSCQRVEKQKYQALEKERSCQNKIMQLQEIIGQYQNMVRQLKQEIDKYEQQLQMMEQNLSSKIREYELKLDSVKRSFSEQRDLWHRKSLEEKERIISVNNFEKKEHQETFRKKIMMLQAQIDCYRGKLYSIERSPEKRSRSLKNNHRNQIDQNIPVLATRENRLFSGRNQKSLENKGLGNERLFGVKDKNIIFV